MHIGLIGGIGPAATEFYYRHITAAHARAKRRLELTIAHADASELVANLRANQRDRPSPPLPAISAIVSSRRSRRCPC